MEEQGQDEVPWHTPIAPFRLAPQSRMLMASLPLHDFARKQQHLRLPRSLLPPKTSDKKVTLVLDLDETLVHCGFDPIPNADIQVDIQYGGRPYKVYGRRRPFLDEFLDEASRHFEIVCFTASQRLYAEKIVQMIDPTGRISHTLYRDSCVSVRGNFLKDLSILGRDLRHTILLDNSPHAFGFQIENGVPIVSWFDDANDTELVSTLHWMRSTLVSPTGDDVRPHVTQRFRVRDFVNQGRR